MTVSNTSAPAQRDLWGGAVTCSLPSRIIDISDVRQVPDHQEAYMDPNTDQALIFEIVEHDATVSNQDCGRHIWNDAAIGNNASSSAIDSIAQLGDAAVPKLPFGTFCCLVRGRQTVVQGQSASEVAALLAVLRLPQVGSDLLITLSTPLTQIAAVAQSEQVMATALASLRIVDWELFGGGDGDE